jgi:hypothetical protein
MGIRGQEPRELDPLFSMGLRFGVLYPEIRLAQAYSVDLRRYLEIMNIYGLVYVKSLLALERCFLSTR